jgi:Synergist-CTERM protein sorting domain-containing protein
VEVDTSEVTSEVSVSTYTTSGCSTGVVLGLSKQIADEVGCMSPGSLVPFSPTTNLVFSSNAVLPYMHSTAKTDLLAVASNRFVQVNSGFRTVAQQYLLYRWYQLGRCGISAAATPGRSNHQSGRAVDLANYSSLISAMANKGWTHPIPGDPVHFEHPSSPDIRGRDVKAFQRLWNRNNPNDKISEDGAYGPQTEARLKKAPATGFAVGASCGTAAAAQPSDVVMIDGPDKLAPNARARYQVTLKNLSGTDWPATTKIVVADGAPSALYDSQMWTSDVEVGTIGSDISAAQQGVIEIPVLAPMVDEATAFQTELSLVDGSTVVGSITLSVTVTPNGDEMNSGDAGDEHGEHEHDEGEFEAGTVTGGCSTGSNLGWLALVLPALVLRRRTRR